MVNYGELLIYFQEVTSSTAQGGGGSFKDRKPIGDVDGWDSTKTV